MDFTIYPLGSQDGSRLLEVSDTLSFLKKDYPDFRAWFAKTVMPEICTPYRHIYVAAPATGQNTLAGIMILKNTWDEKKICTLFVAEAYRSHQLGTKLLDRAIETLGTERPVITVSAVHLAEFEGLFQKFGFTPYQGYSGYYREGVTEYAYNGPIEPCIQGCVLSA